MSEQDFLIFYLCVLAGILVCRCVPLLVLKGRQLPPRVTEALGLIPPAAFVALVANDLFDPSVGFSWQAVLAAALVAVVAKKTGSLIGCALAGMAVYALLLIL